MIHRTEKRCYKCKQTKPIDDFYKQQKRSDGHRAECKKCVNEAKMKHRKTAKGRESELLRGKRYRQKYPEKVKQSHNLRRLKKYGLNVESYNKIFAQQEGKCAICGIHQSELNKSLSVDHCHVSGKIRGLLCTYCNRLLVAYIDKAKPSLKTLQRAIQYIKEQE